MSTTAAGTQGEQNESSILSAAEGPSSKTEARFYHVEIESDGGIPRALVATNTKWRFSVATFMLATTLGLKKIPMTPTQKQHPFETPFGVRYLRDYVPMRIRAPFIGINQSMLVHVGVLGSEETARGEHLFLGANFWKKVAQRKSEMESASMVARELLEPDERASTISPGIPEEPVERRDSSPTPIALITGIAPCGCPTSLCTLTDNMGPGVGTISDLDPERLGSHGTGRRSRPSRSTTRLEATSLFTHNHTSSTSILSSQSTHDMNVEHSYLEDSQNLTSEQPQVELRKGRFQRLSSVKEVDEAVEEIAKERLHAFSHSGSAAFSHTSSLTVDAKPSLLGGASDVLPHESFDFFNRAWLKAIKRMEEIDHQDFTITLPYGQEHQVDQLGSAGNPGNDVEHHNQQLLRENQPDRSSVSISTENESRGGFRSTQSPTVKQNHSGGSQISEESPESEGTRIRDNFDNTTPDICPLDGGVSTHQASWSDFRTTDDANIEGFETGCHLDPLPSIEINEEVADLPLGPLDTLQELAGQHERLRCLISEIKHSYPGSMTQDTYPKPFLADQLKLGLEALTRQKWEWWPFSEPNRPLKEGEVHLEWPCSCGRRRTENVPVEFGQAMVEFVRQGCPSTGTSSTQATLVVPSDNSSNVDGSNILPGSGGTSYPETVVQNKSDNIIAGHPQNVDTREKHIFLVASSGSLNLHQIISTAQCTMDFSNSLRRGYRQLRGFWRYWLSIYKFSHCDFFEFEKFCMLGISDLRPGLPPDESPYTEEYFYKPRPARSNTPISPKEFEHIYYNYRKTSAARINTWYQPFTVMGQAPFYWPRFFKQLPSLFQKQIDGNLPTDTVPKIPQRLTHFDEFSNSRETFWGLHAREQISAFMVSIYTLLALMPWFAFCSVYIFGLGSNEVDIQNATTPLTISLTTVSLFIAWLVKH